MTISRLIILLSIFYSGFVISHSDDTNDYQRLLVDKVNVNEKLSKDKEIKITLDNELIVNFDGENYKINNNVHDIGEAIYIALARGQYNDVNQLLSSYQKLTGHDDLLVKYANAKISHQNKNYQKAINYYQQILQKNSDFLRVELELARVYYESQQNKEAIVQFNRVLDKYAQQLPKHVLDNIAQFTKALKKRTAWRGSISLGYGYNSNINQVPGDHRRDCYRSEVKEVCYGVGEATKGQKFIYEANIEKQVPLYRHHNALFKAYTYGYKYEKASQYNENIINTKSYYQYQDGIKTFAFGPTIEFKFIGDQQRYYGFGASIDVAYHFTPKFSVSAIVDYKKLNYRSMYQSSNGNKSTFYLTNIYAFSPDIIFFGGVDGVMRNKRYQSDSYKQYGIRVGVFKSFSQGFNFLGMASYKKTHFEQPQYALSRQIRDDNEQLYFIKLSAPKYSLFTLTPSLSYKFRKNHSNIDALYSYSQNEVEFKLEKRF